MPAARHALLGLLYAGALAAHPHLTQSTPAEGAVLQAPPGQIVLRFAEPVRLGALTLQQAGAEARRLGPLPAAAQAEIRVALPALTPGAYVVRYRALGADGHVVPGQVHFRLVQ
ncbi:MAG: copper resistance protein CopC [Gammaproteobacteria bacterium]|nr:copper resistance protein CopC [Gammaproteobacteria bacterium]